MFVSRFIKEINRLYPDNGEFVKQGLRDPKIQTALPSFTQFKKSYLGALERHDSYVQNFQSYFDVSDTQNPKTDTPKPGLLWRLSHWYDDGMAHEYLACAWVEAYEEREKLPIVTSDPRVDFKLKADFIIIHNDRSLVVNCAYGNQQDLAGIEYRRGLKRASGQTKYRSKQSLGQ